ncbi:DUF4157 domain-containing protein [Mycolicibacterium iranicum]|uniref:eCIS core domain-containing protein n=1 Tax=Mycolicibacterium iranicum TaxID=912594 RepID=A0A178LS35_MYCIR|nr:DUF4157 domain-containing protein [Mycolicibacterium iranicum]OAN36790.1 hypothetical protein A4X20_06235 [Mycolicibacterium iranicum]
MSQRRSWDLDVSAFDGHCACGGGCPRCSEESGVQTKLKVGEAGDAYEQEADRVAAQVMSHNETSAAPTDSSTPPSSPPPVQRQSAAPDAPVGEEEQEEPDVDEAPFVQALSLTATPSVQRQVMDAGLVSAGEEASVRASGDEGAVDDYEPWNFSSPDGLQLLRTSAHPRAPPTRHSPSTSQARDPRVEDEPSQLTTGGTALPDAVRAFYERRFSRDFSAVRLHVDAESSRRNDSLNARAFTFGNHVWLGSGQTANAPSFVLAHELAHVVQQTRPAELPQTVHGAEPLVSKSLEPVATAQPRVIQRFAAYWEPEDFNGSKTHELLLPAIGKSSKIFTEGPVPNANAGMASVDFNNPKRGFVDFYGASNTVGLLFNGHDNPKRLNDGGALHKLRKDGVRYQSHEDQSGPSVDNDLLQNLVRVDRAPTSILIGDLKPSHGTIEALEGDTQLDNYAKGFKIAQDQSADYAQAHPTRIHPAGQGWPLLGVSRFQETQLSIPPAYDPKKKGNQTPEKLVIKKAGIKVYEPDVEVKGRIYVSKDPKSAGIWNYYWIPVKAVLAQKLPGLHNLRDKVNKELIGKLLESPLKKQPLLKSHGGGDDSTGGHASHSLGRGSPPRSGPAVRPFRPTAKVPVGHRETRTIRRQPATERKDGFDYAGWDAQRVALTTDFGKLGGKKEMKRFEGMALAIEAQKATEGSTGFTFPTKPAEKDVEAVKDYKTVDFWTGASGKVVGLLRRFFGVAFVKVANAYLRIRDKFHEKFKSRPESFKGGGSFAGAVVRIAFKVLKFAGALLIGKTLNYLASSLETGVTNKIQSFLSPDKLAELFLDPERKEELDEKIKEVTGIRDELENRAKRTLEDFVESTIGPYDKVLEQINEAKNVISDVLGLVNLVRWGARVVACLSPPGWGCLWLLGEAALDKFMSMVVETCWFQKKVTPLITAASFIKQLPIDLANLIITAIKDSVLPQPLHDFLPAVPSANSITVSDTEVPCEGGGGSEKLSPEQEALMQVQESLGEDKFKALTELIKNSGVPADKPLSVDEIKKVGELAGGMSAQQLKDLAAKYPPAAEGRKIPLVDALEKAKTKEGSIYDGEPGSESPRYQTVVVGTRAGGPPVIDASKAPEATGQGKPATNISAQVYAQAGHVAHSRPEVWLWLYRDGQHVLTLSKVPMEVVGRNWYPDDVKREKLRVRYRILKATTLEPYIKGAALHVGGIVYGYLPGWGGIADEK